MGPGPLPHESGSSSGNGECLPNFVGERRICAGMEGSGLIGREVELTQLGTELREARERGGALLVSGAPGIGKTSLLDAAAGDARGLGYKVIAVTGLECGCRIERSRIACSSHTARWVRTSTGFSRARDRLPV